VPHVELSITDLGQADLAQTQPAQTEPGPAPTSTPPPREPFGCWASAVADAVEPSLVIDKEAYVVAMSPSCVTMLGLSEAPVGKPLNGGALRLIDFSSQAGVLTEAEIAKIPPLLALTSGRLARGLIRVECDEAVCTLDAIATPIGLQGDVVGSLTFFSTV
jgi:hypothetical protein